MRLLLFITLLTTGCATATLAGDRAVFTADPGQRRVVVLEPFFETAEWRTRMRTERVQVMGSPYGSGLGGGGFYGGGTLGTNALGMPTDVTVQRPVTEKPVYAQVASLSILHGKVLEAVRRARPSWEVVSTSASPSLQGPVTLVRLVVHDAEQLESNRAFKNLAFAFGLVLLPLQLVHLTPVSETDRIYGALSRYLTEGEALRSRLVRYPTQPDFAIDARGLPAPLERRFGLDVTYEEGLFADEAPRNGVLLQGFAEKIAAGVVALVEEP